MTARHDVLTNRLKQVPVYVPNDGEIVVHMWRQTDERKVWYEWMVEVYAAGQPSSETTTGQDPQGKGHGQQNGTQMPKVKIGGSELHSSIKEACLM